MPQMVKLYFSMLLLLLHFNSLNILRTSLPFSITLPAFLPDRCSVRLFLQLVCCLTSLLPHQSNEREQGNLHATFPRLHNLGYKTKEEFREILASSKFLLVSLTPFPALLPPSSPLVRSPRSPISSYCYLPFNYSLYSSSSRLFPLLCNRSSLLSPTCCSFFSSLQPSRASVILSLGLQR